MGWILDTIVNWILELAIDACLGIMDWFTGLIEASLSTSIEAFETTFPIVQNFHSAFLIIGTAMAFAFVLLGLFRNMFAGLGFMGENPVKMGIRTVMAFFAVYTIRTGLLIIYTGTTMGTSDSNTGIFAAMFEAVQKAGSSAAYYSLGGVSSDAWSGGISTLTGGISSLAALIIGLVLIGTIAINYIKLALEIVERYLLLNLLVFFSPLVAPALTLESTMRVFSAYLKMFFGQLIMILLNLVSLKLVISGMSVVGQAFTGGITIPGLSNQGFAPYFCMLMVIGLIKVLQRLDNYARDIGLTVGITGGRLTDELLAAGATVGAATRTIFGHGKSKGGSGSGGGSSQSLFNRLGFTGGIAGMGLGYVGATFKALGASIGPAGVGSKQANMKFGERFKENFQNMSPHRNASAKSLIGGALGYNFAKNNMPFSVGNLNKSLGDKDLSGKAAPFGSFTNAVMGQGGYVATSKSGDTWAVTTSKPNYGSYQTFQTKDGGTTYYAQNLTQTAQDYTAQTGNSYGPLQKAVSEAAPGASNNFAELYTSSKQAFPGAGSNMNSPATSPVPTPSVVSTPSSVPTPEPVIDAKQFNNGYETQMGDTVVNTPSMDSVIAPGVVESVPEQMSFNFEGQTSVNEFSSTVVEAPVVSKPDIPSGESVGYQLKPEVEGIKVQQSTPITHNESIVKNTSRARDFKNKSNT